MTMPVGRQQQQSNENKHETVFHDDFSYVHQKRTAPLMMCNVADFHW